MSPIEQYTVDCEYLAYFEPKENYKKKYKRDIMQLFSSEAKGWNKTPSKVAHNHPHFFQYCQSVQTSPNLNFYFIKMAPYATSIYNDFANSQICQYYH